MTLPNHLSLSRILIIPLLLFCALFDQWTGSENHFLVGGFRVAAWLIVIGAAITDYFDGKLARSRGQISNLGKLLDPLADKLLVSAGFVMLIDLRIFPGWFVILMLFREFLVTGIRGIAVAHGRVIQANRWGKHKTGWQLAAIITALLFRSMQDFAEGWGVWEPFLARRYFADIFASAATWGVAWVSMLFAAISAWEYVGVNLDLLGKDAAGGGAAGGEE